MWPFRSFRLVSSHPGWTSAWLESKRVASLTRRATTCHDLPRRATLQEIMLLRCIPLMSLFWWFEFMQDVRLWDMNKILTRWTRAHTQTWHDCGYRTFLISLYKADRMQIVFSRGGRAAERFFEQNGWSLCPKRIYATYNISKILQTCPNLVLGLVLWSGLNSLASFDFWLQR